MKQTSVEWLYNELSKYVIHKPIGLAEWEILKELTEQAKAMEKEQIEDAFDTGTIDEDRIGKEYYNETYNK
jgi:hypothetical protein